MATPPSPSSNKNRRLGERRTGPRAGGAVWYILGFLLLLALAQAFFFQLQGGDISYSDFKNLVRQDKVQEVTLSDDRVRGERQGTVIIRCGPFVNSSVMR